MTSLCLFVQLPDRTSILAKGVFIVRIIGRSLLLNHSPSEWFSSYKKQAVPRTACFFASQNFLQAAQSKRKISSIGAPTAREISTARRSEGLYWAFSSRMIVSRRTPTICASCSWVSPFSCRNSFSLTSPRMFFVNHLQK